MFGRAVAAERNPIAVSLAGGAQLANSDYADPLVRPTASLEVRYGATPRIELGLGVTGGGLAADRSLERLYGGADAFLRYNVIPRAPLTPFISVGASALLLVDPDIDPEQPLVPALNASAGLELAVTPQAGLTLALAHTYALADALDDTRRGTYHDNVWTLRTGVTFYFR
jgi:hypothetical protein